MILKDYFDGSEERPEEQNVVVALWEIKDSLVSLNPESVQKEADLMRISSRMLGLLKQLRNHVRYGSAFEKISDKVKDTLRGRFTQPTALKDEEDTAYLFCKSMLLYYVQQSIRLVA